MKLIDAQTRIEKLAYIPFKNYLSPDQIQDAMMKINKGKTGQLLELTIGLNLSNTTLDFEDGELKTNKIPCRILISSASSSPGVIPAPLSAT